MRCKWCGSESYKGMFCQLCYNYNSNCSHDVEKEAESFSVFGVIFSEVLTEILAGCLRCESPTMKIVYDQITGDLVSVKEPAKKMTRKEGI